MSGFEPALFPSQGRSNVPGKQTLHLEVTYTSGVPSAAWGSAIVLVHNSGTGQIAITLPRTYRKLVAFRHGWKTAPTGAVLAPVISSNAVSTDNGSGQGTITIETRVPTTGTATAPGDGSILSLEFDVSNDVLNDGYAVAVS